MARSPDLLNPDQERGAAIQAARFFAAVVELRALFAVAHRAEPVGADAAAREVVADRGRAALAQGQVVLRRADVAGVPLDLEAQVWIVLQRSDRFVERSRRLGTEAVAIEVEVHVL